MERNEKLESITNGIRLIMYLVYIGIGIFIVLTLFTPFSGVKLPL